jgi:hypothetical protein
LVQKPEKSAQSGQTAGIGAGADFLLVTESEVVLNLFPGDGFETAVVKTQKRPQVGSIGGRGVG